MNVDADPISCENDEEVGCDRGIDMWSTGTADTLAETTDTLMDQDNRS